MPDFKADVTSGCAPIVVKFQDLSTGGPAEWFWDLGNGATSTLQNPAATYIDPGVYRISLKVTNANGSTSIVRDSFIRVYNKPDVAFDVSDRNACTPAPIQFTDFTDPGPGNAIVSWKWDFGTAGATSTEQNPRFVYKVPEPNGYTITLTVTNDKGCSNLKTEPNFIKVIKGVVPKFTNTQQTVCKPPVNITFTNTSTGPDTLNYFWDFGDGQTSTEKNPINYYNSVGSFPVTLVVQSSYGCTDTLRKLNAVTTTQIITDFDVPAVCLNTEVQFFDSSSEFSISNLWKFSDGTSDPSASPYKTFTTPGTYTVTLINNYASCTDSVTKTVDVAANPAIDFSANPVSGCQLPLNVTFTNPSGSAYSYQWNFGDSSILSTEPNPTHPYTREGNYNVTLTATNASGCGATLTKPAFIKIQKPVITFNNLPTRGCIPYTISPTASIVSVDSITSYQWDFGDGGKSSQQNPTYMYTVQGKYTVTLTVTTASGCTETYALPDAVKVGTKPTTGFTFDKNNICASETVTFSDTSSPSDEWRWVFGDGGSASTKVAPYMFADTGTISVKLNAYNSGCAGDSVVKFVVVKGPIAAYTFTPTNCSDIKTYSFKNTSIENLTGVMTWLWDFGDGSPVIPLKDPPPHTFPGLGTYAVTLTVSNGECTSTKTQSITIAKYVPDFKAVDTVGCKPFAATFTPAALGDTLIKSYRWNFGDGTPETATTGDATHVYTVTGNYNVQLITTNIYGCDDTSVLKTNYIRVNGPAAKFSSQTNQGCVGLTTTFLDETATDGQNPIKSWKWNFGDRTTQTYTDSTQPFQHVYSKVARYDVSLVVTDAAGCTDSITYDNFVRTSSFKMEWSGTRQTCPGKNATFTPSSNTRNYKTFWDFGNGGTASSDITPVKYAFPDTGTYTIKLVITDTLGCKDSLIKSYYTQVYRPVANFSANNFSTYCVPFEAHFTNSSTYYTASSWNLGIGTSTQTNPVSYYTKTGTYNIRLRVTSPGGCTDDTTQVLHVYDAKDGKLTYGPLDFACRPLHVNFNAFSDMKGRFVWDFGDGTVVDTSINAISHTYENVGNFIPKIILYEPSGCPVPLTGSAPVQVGGAKIAFGINKNFFCDSGLITISDSTQVRGNNIKYNWDFGDGVVSHDPKPPTHYYSSPGTYPLKLTITNGNGCTDSMAIRPGVRVSLTPVIRITGDSVICVNQFLQSGGVFTKRDSSFIRWAWQFPNGTSSAVQLPPDQQFKQAGTFPINAIATNSEGCAGTAVKNVLVHPLPTSTLPSTVTLQAGFPLVLAGSYSSNVESWTWRPATGLSCTNCPNPEASPKFNTKYIVQFVDSNKCMNTNTVQVIVLCKNANVFIPNTFSPNGDGSNDVFYVRGRGLDRVKSLRIFNRWGEVVFEKQNFPVNDASVGWDGRYKGLAPKADVYIYQVEVFCENSDVIRFEGNVALIQ